MLQNVFEGLSGLFTSRLKGFQWFSSIFYKIYQNDYMWFSFGCVLLVFVFVLVFWLILMAFAVVDSKR